MSREENIAAQERFGEQIIKLGNLDVMEELTTPDFVDRDPAPDQVPGPQGLKDFWAAFRTGFPDLDVAVDQLVADDENVAIAYRATGTHDGDFAGIGATGRKIDIRGVQIARFADGKMVERWGSSDQLTMLQQLGVAG